MFVERRYTQGYVHRAIHVVLPRELYRNCFIGTLACHERATALTSVLELVTRSPLHALGGSVSFTVTEPFPFLRPWHCVDVSLLPPCGCRRESLPRRRLAHRARSRAFGNMTTNARYCPHQNCPRPLWCRSWKKPPLFADDLQWTMYASVTRCVRFVV